MTVQPGQQKEAVIVRFEPMSDHRTWILVKIGFDMSGIYHWLGGPLPSINRSLELSLKRFHNFLAIQTLVEGTELLPVV